MPNQEKPFEIDISKPSKDFDRHLTLPQNERIIFSGGFGTGKTYFLNKYFKRDEEKAKESFKYKVLHLYPVNYSIASNEDIFELIKYDIIFELLSKDIELQKISYPKVFTAQFFLLNKTNQILNILVEKAFAIKKSIIPYYDQIVELKNEFDKIYEDFNKFHVDSQIDEYKKLLQYTEQFKEIRGSIYEEDTITLLIRELVEQLKENGKEVVLIIDDLDRIDPEHIFRLFNIFSAHFDIKGSGNKFDVNKVILVCDIENIRNIFHAKYGTSTDFTGYIDKFYSQEIFKFDNLNMISNNISRIFKTIKLNDRDMEYFFIHDSEKQITNELAYILTCMVLANAITLRSLIKLLNNEYDVRIYELNFGAKRKYNKNFLIILIFDFLKFVFGDRTTFEQALNKTVNRRSTFQDLKDQYDPNNYIKIGSLLPILDMLQYQIKDEVITYESSYYFKINYWNKAYDYNEMASVRNIENPENANYFVLLQETYQKLLSLKMLQ